MILDSRILTINSTYLSSQILVMLYFFWIGNDYDVVVQGFVFIPLSLSLNSVANEVSAHICSPRLNLLILESKKHWWNWNIYSCVLVI